MRRRPPWWPENEPWPPRRGDRRHGMPPFGCAVAMMIAAFILFRSTDRAFLAIGAAAAVAAIAILWVVFRGMNQRLRAKDRVRRQLMADVAHELRTPLAILQGRIEGLIDGVYPRDDERLTGLLEETRHLSRLVEDVRTLSNAEAGALELKKEMTDPAELIRDAASAFESIEVNMPDDLPLIEIDPVRIREVLLNLLSNAARAGGTVTIHAEAQARQLIIRVNDTGKGIAAEDLPRIFDRFYKGGDSRGSGLGLAIARNLVLAHGGTIDAESVVGEGTTITITLPR